MQVDTKQGAPGQGAGSISPLQGRGLFCLAHICFHMLLQNVLCSRLTAVSERRGLFLNPYSQEKSLPSNTSGI